MCGMDYSVHAELSLGAATAAALCVHADAAAHTAAYRQLHAEIPPSRSKQDVSHSGLLLVC